MAEYLVTSPDGTKYKVTGPEGASKEEVLSRVNAYKTMPGQIGAIASKQALTPTKKAIDQDLLPLAGGVVGGMVGNVPGAAIGAEVGTIAKQAADVAAGKPVTTKGLLSEQALETGGMALGEGAGRAISGVTEKILGAIGRKLTTPRPGAREAQQTLQSEGGTLSVGQSVKGAVPEIAEKIGRLGVFGRPVFEQLDETNQQALKTARDDLIKSYSTIPPDVIAKRSGTLFQDVVNKGEEAFNKFSTGLYQQFDANIDQFAKKQAIERTVIPARTGLIVDERGAPLTNIPEKTVSKIVTTNKVVNTDSIKRWAGEELKKYDAINKRPPPALVEIANTPSNIGFGDAQFDRSLAIKKIRDLESGTSKDTASLAYLKQYQSKMLGEMDRAAQNLPGELYGEYRKISDVYRRGSTAFGNDAIVQMMSKNPESVADYLYQTGNVSEVTQAKATLRQAKKFDPSLDTETAWKNIQAAYLTRLFTASSARGVEGEVVGKGMSKALGTEKNARTLSAMFDQQEVGKIKAIVESARISQGAAKGGGNLELAIPIGQGAAIAALTTEAYAHPGHEVKSGLAAGAVLLGPRVLAKMLTNPETVNALLSLPRISARNPKIIPILTKIGVQKELVEKEIEREDAEKNRPTAMFSDPNMEQARKTGSTMQGVRG